MFWSTAKYWRARFFSLLFSQMEREELWAQKANVRGQEWNEFNIYETNEQNQRHQQFHSRTSNLRIKCVTTSFSRLLNMGKCVVRARPPIYRKLYKNGTVLWAETHTHTHWESETIFIALVYISFRCMTENISHSPFVPYYCCSLFSSFYVFHLYSSCWTRCYCSVFALIYIYIFLYCFPTQTTHFPESDKEEMAKRAEKTPTRICVCVYIYLCKYRLSFDDLCYCSLLNRFSGEKKWAIENP